LGRGTAAGLRARRLCSRRRRRRCRRLLCLRRTFPTIIQEEIVAAAVDVVPQRQPSPLPPPHCCCMAPCSSPSPLPTPPRRGSVRWLVPSRPVRVRRTSLHPSFSLPPPPHSRPPPPSLPRPPSKPPTHPIAIPSSPSIPQLRRPRRCSAAAGLHATAGSAAPSPPPLLGRGLALCDGGLGCSVAAAAATAGLYESAPCCFVSCATLCMCRRLTLPSFALSGSFPWDRRPGC